jgi:hypothetical protein
MNEMTVAIPSVLHGERVWRRVGERDHVTRDGRAIVLTPRSSPTAMSNGGWRTAARMAAVETADNNSVAA